MRGAERGLEKGRGRRREKDRRKVEKVVSWKDELFSGEKLAHVAHNAHLRFACVSVAHLAHDMYLLTSCSYVKRIKLFGGGAHTWCIKALCQHGTHTNVLNSPAKDRRQEISACGRQPYEAARQFHSASRCSQPPISNFKHQFDIEVCDST